MKVVLINSNVIKPPVTPIGLLYLSAYLKTQGVSVEVVDLCMEDRSSDAAASVSVHHPDVIGVSLRNIDSTQMRLNHYFLPDVLSLVHRIREGNPRVPLVMGGAGFSIAPMEIMAMSNADYGIIGEGEWAFAEFLRRREAQEDMASIPGLVYRDARNILHANPPQNTDSRLLSTLPFQDIGAVDYNAYFHHGGMASLQTKRGCALDCCYCTYPLVEGKNYRLIDPRRVVDEMEFLMARGYDYFHFTDSVFNIPRHHALAVCREIIRRGLKTKWHTYVSPQGFDEELLEAFIQAGNDGIMFGADSCSERMLVEMGKSFVKKDIARAARLCRGKGMEFSINVIFGAPGESLETVQETLDTLDELRPTAAFLTQGIRVYKHTPIYARLLREGKLKGDEKLVEPFFYFSELLPPDFQDMIHRYTVERDFVFSETVAKSPSTNKDIVNLYMEGFRGPCWRVLRELGKSAKASA
jgi:radical SAM superfamily enzyme YgiQ (UPF0313 family)